MTDNVSILEALAWLEASATGAYIVACDDHGCTDCGNSDEHDDGCAFRALLEDIEVARASLKAAGRDPFAA